LAAAEDDIVLDGRNGGRVEWCVGYVFFENFKRIGREQLGALVFGGSDEVCSVGGKLQVGDVGFVDRDLVNELTRLLER
jgi:hypothetical protein